MHQLSSVPNVSPTRHGRPLPKPTTFLDLPAELRVKIYPTALRRNTEQHIKLKAKTNARGKVYVKEPTPPLCYAIPSLWDEILSVYYSENRFHIRLSTQVQRNAFETWVRHRGPLLKGLRYLILNPSVSLSAVDVWGDLVEVERDTYATLRLMTYSLSPDLGLVAWWRCKSYKSQISCRNCGCWLVEAVNEGLGSEPTGSTNINAVIDFALKICRIYDLGKPLCGQLVKRDTLESKMAAACAHCGARCEVVVADSATQIIRKSSPVFKDRNVFSHRAQTADNYVTY